MVTKLLNHLILLLWISIGSANAASNLAGKSIVITYDTGAVYVVSYEADLLTWSALKGPDGGKSETNEYEHQLIKPGVHFIRWSKEDGTVVHSILDLNLLTAHTSIWASTPVPFLKGNLKQLE